MLGNEGRNMFIDKVLVLVMDIRVSRLGFWMVVVMVMLLFGLWVKVIVIVW